MALPGNYALGYLEEDNPLKAYFRFRPLFLHEDGRYHPFAEPEQFTGDEPELEPWMEFYTF